MTIERTAIKPTHQAPLTSPYEQALEGKVAHFLRFSVTDSSDTTAACFLGGLVPWRLINESGGAITFTFYDALERDGTELDTFDDDNIAVVTIALADDGSVLLPTGLSGCTWLVIKGSAAADNITLTCKR